MEKKRFGELQYHIDSITKKVFDREPARTRENYGIVFRKECPGVTPKTEYALTDIGSSLQPVFESLIIWSLGYSNLYKERLKETERSS